MSQALRKMNMLSSRMINLYLKDRTDLNWSNYKKKGISVQILFVRLKSSAFQNSG